MNKLKTFWQGALLLAFGIGLHGLSFAQCSFTGLEETYCVSDEPSTLVGEPGTGVFSGPGMTGDVFDPAMAGPGTHTITYTILASGDDKFYLRAAGGEPWFGGNTPETMDDAFGVGEWTLGEYETVDPAIVFAPTTAFVFMDGGSFQASELQAFLAANIGMIEDWVDGGGRLLLNAAPNEGADIDFGFDGTTLSYIFGGGSYTHVNNVEAVDPAHPALLGPLVPTATAMSGTYYGHSLITGVGYTDVLIEVGEPTKVVLAEKCWGAGRVMVGGMTTANFHNPDPQAENWRSNLYTYLYENPCGGLGDDDCVTTQEVTVYADPVVGLTVAPEEICEGEEVTFTASGADTYVFDVPGITSGDPYTPTTTGTTTYTVTGTVDATGCEATASVDVLVNPTPVVTASTDDDEVCFGDAMTLTGGGAATYVWDMGVTNGVPFTPGPIGPITYTVIGTSDAGCTNTASISIEVIDCEPVFAGFTFDNNICVGDCIAFTDTSIGTTVNSWEWDFGGGGDPLTSSEQNPANVCFNTVGDFNISLTITSLYGQVSTATHTITVNELPELTVKRDTIIELGGKADIIATSTIDGDFTWKPDDHVECPTCPITTASPIDSTRYTVLIIDENGCTDEDEVLVLVNFVKGVGVPSAFSPNGDGNNDILYVKGLGLAAVNLIVYNRYGEVVFETSDQNIGWDGTFKGRDENPGVFTWVLHYDFVTGDKGFQRGNTTLIR